MFERQSGIIAVLSVGLAAFLLSGCAALRLYDENKAKMSAGVKEKYSEADVVGVIDVEKNNLDALHAEEMKVVRDNFSLQLDLSLLELADNDSPMAETWHDEIEASVTALGFADSAQMRGFLNGSDEQSLRSLELERLRRLIQRAAGQNLAECKPGGTLPAELTLLPGVTPQDAARAKERYGTYKAVCQRLQNTQVVMALRQGKLKKAKDDWETAKNALAGRRKEMEAAKEKVAAVTAKYETAMDKVKKAGAKDEAVRIAIKETADDLRSGLESAGELAPQVLSEERLSAIVTLLKAAASEQTQVENNPDLAKAVLLVNGLASLSGDVAGLVAKAKAPSVSNLLIELQHQTVLMEHAKAVETLEEQRVHIRESKYAAYLEEADLLLAFRDALCSLTFHVVKKKHPAGEACDQFEVTQEKVGDTDAVWVCRFSSGDSVIDNDPADKKCPLFKPWNAFLKQPPSDNAGREFFKALANYTRLFPVRASQIEQDFNLIDLQHKQNLASREMALRAWNNLAAVPIDQLSAYYQAGLKPEVIADLIVKALGFTAITAGVSSR
jgi:hypothetical protein